MWRILTQFPNTENRISQNLRILSSSKHFNFDGNLKWNTKMANLLFWIYNADMLIERINANFLESDE